LILSESVPVSSSGRSVTACARNSQPSDQTAQALPSLGVICNQDDEAGSAFLVKKICAQGDLTPQVIKQLTHVQWFVDADIASIIKLAGVQVPTLDESLGQHQGRSREFSVRNWFDETGVIG
jgi:hypothetical protein